METNTQKSPLNGKKIALFVVYGIVAILLLVTVLSFNDLPSIVEQLKTVNVGYVLLAVLMVVVYLALYPLSLCILAKARKVHASSKVTYSVAMTEHFFNGITPWATGGQPFQAHSLSKINVKLSESTGLLLANLVVYMLASNGIALVGLFFFDELCSSIDSWWLPIIFVGYIINFSILTIMIVLGKSKTVRGWLVRFVRFLCKYKMFRKLESKADEIEEYFVQVQVAFADLMKKKWHFLLALLTKVGSLLFYYAAAFFIILSLNIPVDGSHLLLVIVGTSFALTAVGFVPTPGASGGVEGSTGQVYKSLIMHVTGGGTNASAVVATANGVMLIWRLLSYYFIMIVSLFFYIGLEIYFSRKNKKNT